MPRLLTAAKIAEGALQRIGAFASHDEAPDPDELEIALGKLDLIVGELAGVMTCYWLVPDEFVMPLVAGQSDYNLLTALGSDYPDEGLQFPLSAYLQYPPTVPPSTTRRVPIEIVRRRTFLAHDQLDQGGYPEEIYIDRLDPPTLRTFRTINLPGYAIVLHYQTYAADQTASEGAHKHGLPAAWQRWAEIATACDIGDGPVRRIKPDALGRLKQEREMALIRLRSFNNREKSTRRAVAYRDF